MKFNKPPIAHISEEDVIGILKSAGKIKPVLSISELTKKLNETLHEYVFGIYARTIRTTPSQLAASFNQIHSSTKKLRQLLESKIGRTEIPPAEILNKIPSMEFLEMHFWVIQNQVDGPVFHNLVSDLELLEKISDELASKHSKATLDTAARSRKTENLVINRFYLQIYDLWKEAYGNHPGISASEDGCPITRFIHEFLTKIVEKNKLTPEFQNLFDSPIPTYSAIGSRLIKLSRKDLS